MSKVNNILVVTGSDYLSKDTFESHMSTMEITMGIHQSDLLKINMSELVSLFKKSLPKNQAQSETTNQVVDPLPTIGNKHPLEYLLYDCIPDSNVVPPPVPKTGGSVG